MRRAQTYALDLALGMFLLLLVASLVAAFGMTRPPPSAAGADAGQLAGALFTPLPRDWDLGSVILPGVVEDHRLNTTLLDRFASLPQKEVQELTGITSNYSVTVLWNDTTLAVAGALPDIDADNVRLVRRYAAYNGSIATLEVIAWD